MHDTPIEIIGTATIDDKNLNEAVNNLQKVLAITEDLHTKELIHESIIKITQK